MVNLHTHILEVEIFHMDYTYEVLRKMGNKRISCGYLPWFVVILVKKI